MGTRKPMPIGAVRASGGIDAHCELVLFVDVFEAGIYAFRSAARLRTLRIGCYVRRCVVKVAVVFIVGEDEDGLLPGFRDFW